MLVNYTWLALKSRDVKNRCYFSHNISLFRVFHTRKSKRYTVTGYRREQWKWRGKESRGKQQQRNGINEHENKNDMKMRWHEESKRKKTEQIICASGNRNVLLCTICRGVSGSFFFHFISNKRGKQTSMRTTTAKKNLCRFCAKKAYKNLSHEY